MLSEVKSDNFWSECKVEIVQIAGANWRSDWIIDDGLVTRWEESARVATPWHPLAPLSRVVGAVQ